MLNYRQSSVKVQNSFVDEFDNEAQNVRVNNDNYAQEEKAFNAKIADNFDRIVNYNHYAMQEEATKNARAYGNFVSGAQTDANPSSTTMQYSGMPKAEIYQDYREEEVYQTETKLRPRAKIAMVLMSIVIAVLTALVIFNTALLNNMNSAIEGRLSEIESLQSEQALLEEELASVSSDETVIKNAGEIGMKF